MRTCAWIVLAVAACADEDARGPCDGQHDGGDGVCVQLGTCRGGYLLDDDGGCSIDPAGTFVKMIRPNGSFAGARVVFGDASGAVLSEELTNGIGEAGASMDDGWVTVWFKDAQYLVSRWAPKGSHLTFVAPLIRGRDAQIIGALDLAFDDLDGASDYHADTGFGTQRVSLDGRVVPLHDEDSAAGDDATIVVTALDGGDRPLAWSTAVAPVTAAGAATFGTWRRDFTEVVVAPATPPAGTARATFDVRVLDRHRVYTAIDSLVAIDGAALGGTVHAPPTGGAAALDAYVGELGHYRRRVAVLPAVPAAVTLDLAGLPPRINLEPRTGPGGRHALAWTSDAPLGGDVVVASFTIEDAGLHWRVEAPVDRTTIEQPALPASLDALNATWPPVAIAIDVLEDSRRAGYPGWMSAAATAWDLADGGPGTLLVTGAYMP